MELHESLAQLARDHGESLFWEADAFRGALDDYLDEGSASTGTINLLTDAVRLGALQAMVTMLDSGASVHDAVESAGQRLSRDRGSADVAGSQWACAVLGYALGRVPVSLAARLRPDAYTAEPPKGTQPRPDDPDATSIAPLGQSPAAPLPPAPSQAPPVSPAQQWPQPSAQQSPAQQWPGPSATPSQPQQPGSYSPPASATPFAYTASPGYGAPPPKKSSSGLIIGAIVAIVLFGLIAIVGIIALSGGGGDTPSADDKSSDKTSSSDGVSTTAIPTDAALTERGTGYTYQLPNSDWKDLTADTPDDTGTIDTITAPGASIGTARGNILVESSSSFGQTDVNQLTSDWKNTLQQGTGATPTDIGTMEIDGKTAVGVELKWTNGNNFDVHQIAYLVVSGDNQYSITASFRQGDNGFKDTFYSVLSTWSWTD
jgi:hypothetical protein